MFLLEIFLLTFFNRLNGLSENQIKYINNCPKQNLSLPCLPSNIDQLVAKHANNNINNILAKVHIPGVCYTARHRFCPTLLRRCLNNLNYGLNYSVSGVCIGKGEACPPLREENSCNLLAFCDHTSYLCHPQGCIPESDPCNGKCPPKQTKIHLVQEWDNTSASPNDSSSQAFMLDEAETVLEERRLCGNTCLTRNESVDVYNCGHQCQAKSKPCAAAGENICPQHFTLCGADTCIDRFVENLTVSETGYPGFYSCIGVCTPAVVPCRENTTVHCQFGYWLCSDQKQCILRNEIAKQGFFFSQLCDGIYHCKDGSDENYAQCFWAYIVEVLVCLVLFVFTLAGLFFCLFHYRKKLFDLTRLTAGEVLSGKSYLGNEDEMHLRGVAPEDVD